MKKLLYIFLTLYLIFISQHTVAQAPPSYVPTDGLVGYWPFDGNANDESGNGNNGIVNGAVLTNDRFNNENSAYYFDGINDNIIASPLALVNEVVSISLWIKNDNNIGEWNGIITTQPDVSQGFLLQENQNDKYDLTVATGTSYVDLFSNNSISNQWDHFVCIISDDLMSIYINGVLDATQSVGSYSLYSTANLCIGSRYDYNEWFKGKLDDIGIWNRTLTQQEITDLYDSNSLGIDDLNQLDISIYPNPVIDKLFIQGLSNPTKISVYDILGKLVLSKTTSSEINVDNLQSGIYILKIVDNQKEIVRRFIKN